MKKTVLNLALSHNSTFSVRFNLCLFQPTAAMRLYPPQLENQIFLYRTEIEFGLEFAGTEHQALTSRISLQIEWDDLRTDIIPLFLIVLQR